MPEENCFSFCAPFECITCDGFLETCLYLSLNCLGHGHKMFIYLREKMKIHTVFFSNPFCAVLFFHLPSLLKSSLYFSCASSRGNCCVNRSSSVCKYLASDAQCSPLSLANKGEEECGEELGLENGLE